MREQWIPGPILRFFEWAWVRGYEQSRPQEVTEATDIHAKFTVNNNRLCTRILCLIPRLSLSLLAWWGAWEQGYTFTLLALLQYNTLPTSKLNQLIDNKKQIGTQK